MLWSYIVDNGGNCSRQSTDQLTWTIPDDKEPLFLVSRAGKLAAHPAIPVQHANIDQTSVFIGIVTRAFLSLI